jgi:chromosome segregation ATPase
LKEIDIENFSNEISRVRIDNLNCEQQNDLLKKKLDDLIAELKDREKEVYEFEQSIKKRHNIIDKKQLKVDKLNRIWAQLKEKGGDDENSGPMEAKKNNIIKQTKELEDQIVNTQKQWISNQTDLIERQNTHMTLSTDCEELRTQKSILEQKKLRLNSQVQTHEKEIRQLEVAKNNLDFEMNKLNDLFYKNTDLQEKLKNDNFNIENEFKQKLKELENQSIRLENNISSLKESKADILAEIVEAERQILLWERKIQLEKEMQDALDPTIGQTEIVAMRKEIHRMNLRYEQLRKKQEEMIKDMERSVFKRETIQLKYLPKVEKKNAQDKSSQGKLSRQIANLKQTLKHTTENTMKLDQSIEQRLKELEEINRDIQQNKDVQAQEEQMNQ